MKVVFLLGHLKSGGAERTVSYLAPYFAENGVDTSILLLSSDVFYEIDPVVRVDTLGIPSVPSTPVERLSNAFKRFSRVRRWIKKERPDVVFCILPEMAQYVMKLKDKFNFILITSERNNPAVIKNKARLKLKDKAFRASDLIIFQTEEAKKFYSDNIQSKGVVIPNAVGNPLAYKVKWDPNHYNKTITAVGRLTLQKDYTTLISAFSKLHEVFPAYKLCIFGEGEQKAELTRFVEQCNLQTSVEFMGISTQAIRDVAQSNMYVLSSLFEGMPNALMEALAVGVPCVSTNCPNGPSELICNDVNGYLVPIGDAECMYAAMRKIIEFPEIAERFSVNSKKILQTHSVENISQKYLQTVSECYREVKK